MSIDYSGPCRGNRTRDTVPGRGLGQGRNFMRTRKIMAGVFATTFAVLAGVGVTWAAWSTSGSGTGTGAAKTAQALIVTPVAVGSSGASLYPGGPAGWIYITVQNPNPYGITVTGLSWGTPVSNNPTACPSSNISVDPSAPTTTSLSVAANTTSGAIQIMGVLDLAHSAPDGCQGNSFSVPVTLTGVQQ